MRLEEVAPCGGVGSFNGMQGIAADGGNIQTTCLQSHAAVPFGMGRGLHSHRQPLRRVALTHRRGALGSTVRHGGASACARRCHTPCASGGSCEAAEDASGRREIREVAAARHSDSTFNNRCQGRRRHKVAVAAICLCELFGGEQLNSGHTLCVNSRPPNMKQHTFSEPY